MGILGVLVIPRLATPKRRLSKMAGLFCAFFLASQLLQAQDSRLLIAGFVLQGIARGSMMTIAILILVETPSVPPDRLGLAGGMFFTTAQIGGVLGPLSFGMLSEVGAGFTVSLAGKTLVCTALMVILYSLRKSCA